MRLLRFSKAKKIGSHLRYEGLETLEHIGCSCLLCDKLQSHSDRQADSLFHLWNIDADFRREFSMSKGLCLPDTAKLITAAPEFLSGDSLTGFQSALQGMLDSSLGTLQEELSWYTQKFDYRNANESWKNAKGALERTVNKLRGWCLGDEPMQDELP